MSKRMSTFAATLAFGLVACGGGDTADQAAPPATDAAPAAPAAEPAAPAAPATLTVPEWMQVDAANRTVTMTITAGSTSANNYWNFNGNFGGTGGITVPEGYTVTINLVNADPAMAHSLGVDEAMASYPNMFSEVTPAFEGAATANPTSMTESTLPGETETITFVANRAGDFVIICYVTGHAATGMWVPFTVSTDGSVGSIS